MMTFRQLESENQTDKDVLESLTDGDIRVRSDGSGRKSSGNYCDNCDGWVTPDYHRVFSDNEGYLDGCLDCEGHGQGGSFY